MLSGQEFLHFSGRGQVKRLIHSRLICVGLATRNIGTMTGKKMESVDVMRRRKIEIAYFWGDKVEKGKGQEI